MGFRHLYLKPEVRKWLKEKIEREGFIPIVAYEELPINNEKVILIYIDMDCNVCECEAIFKRHYAPSFNDDFIGVDKNIRMLNCIAWKHVEFY